MPPWRVPAAEQVLIQGPRTVDFRADFSPWDEVISIKLGRWVVALETRIYIESSFIEPVPSLRSPHRLRGR